MAANAFVCWIEHSEPWTLEEALMAGYDVPLNLDQNRDNSFYQQLAAARKAPKARALALPVLAQ